MKINKMFALMGAFLLMSAPLAMNASSQRAARKAVRAKSSKTVSKAAKPKQKKGFEGNFHREWREVCDGASGRRHF